MKSSFNHIAAGIFYAILLIATGAPSFAGIVENVDQTLRCDNNPSFFQTRVGPLDTGSVRIGFDNNDPYFNTNDVFMLPTVTLITGQSYDIHEEIMKNIRNDNAKICLQTEPYRELLILTEEDSDPDNNVTWVVDAIRTSNNFQFCFGGNKVTLPFDVNTRCTNKTIRVRLLREANCTLYELGIINDPAHGRTAGFPCKSRNNSGNSFIFRFDVAGNANQIVDTQRKLKNSCSDIEDGLKRVLGFVATSTIASGVGGLGSGIAAGSAFAAAKEDEASQNVGAAGMTGIVGGAVGNAASSIFSFVSVSQFDPVIKGMDNCNETIKELESELRRIQFEAPSDVRVAKYPLVIAACKGMDSRNIDSIKKSMIAAGVVSAAGTVANVAAGAAVIARAKDAKIAIGLDPVSSGVGWAQLAATVGSAASLVIGAVAWGGLNKNIEIAEACGKAINDL